MAPKQKNNTRLEAAAERAAAVQQKKEQNALKKKVGKEDPKSTVPGKPATSFMDPKVWVRLQHHLDLLEHVYCRLSLEAFFELRAVCKAWYAVACRRMALKSSIPKPFFPLYTRGGRFYRLDGILTYNKSVKAKPPRRRIHFMGQFMEPRSLHPSLVYKPSWVWKRRGDSQDLVPSSHQIVASEGLVCSYRPGYEHPGLTVHVHDWHMGEDKNHVLRSFRCNVRSRHVAEVPHNGRVQTVLGMLVCLPLLSSGLHPFKLVLGCLELDTLVYDSERQSWERQPCRPMVRGGNLLHPTTGCAACNGRVYITQEFSREILVFDFESASWSSIDAPTAGGAVTPSMRSQHYCNDTLGAWNGRILDVVDDADSSDSLSLWELVDDETWRVFDRMPEDLYRLWLRGRDDPADQLRNEALLTIHASFCGDYVLVYSWLFKYEWARRFCLYNMATKVWQKLEVDARTVFIKRRRGSDDWDGWDE